jgi:putative addiction module CopG family antidote
MNVTLDPKFEFLVRQKLESGEYRSAEEIVNAALQLLSERDEDRRVLLQVYEGEPLPVDERFETRLEALLREAEDSGEPTEMTEQDWDDFRREGLSVINLANRHSLDGEDHPAGSS